jgi:glycosyltransferase involved in cell wall biosynthesis
VRWFVKPFLGHIEQKNAALVYARHDWVLSLDADEALSDGLIAEIMELKTKTEPKHHAYRMPRLNHYCGRPIKHGGWYPDIKTRLWNKELGAWGGLNPHDKVVMLKGSSTHLLGSDLLHFSYDTVAEHWQKARKYAQIGAKAKVDAGKTATYLHVVFAPVWRFVQAFFLQLGILDGRYGFQIALISAVEKYWKYKHMLLLRSGYVKK